MQEKKGKVLVAMSGGVDSSVAAALLLEQGYEVTGAFMVNYAEEGQGTECWVPDYRDAVRVAAKLGIPLLKLDFTKEYRELVLDYMYREYNLGRTPNPDVMCNKFVKFGVWLDKARELGFDKLATGHYAKVGRGAWDVGRDKKILPVTRHSLLVPHDKDKDQTYFLHQLSQDQLSHVLFPIGDYTKQEVRELAKKFDLPTAEKEESMGICFVGEVPMKEFLKNKVEAKPGNIITPDGEFLGKHDGLPFYTIGQRNVGVESQRSKVKSQKGDSKALFVVDKRVDTNELVVGFEDDPLLYKKEIEVSDIHWISGQNPIFPLKCEVRMRHRQTMQNAECRMQNKKIIVEFEKPQRAVTPGQFAVFYLNGECLGGAEIV